MKKGAVQLSAGFLVILILSMVVFGIGVMLVTQIFQSAEDLTIDLDAQTESQIRSSLKDSSVVSLPFNRLTIKRKDMDVTGVGILNKLGAPAPTTFYVGAVCTALLSGDADERLCDSNVNQPCDAYCGNFATVDDAGVTLENNRDTVSNIFFVIPKDAESGTYVFNIGVCAGSACPIGALKDPQSQPGVFYGALKKVYVTVP